MIKKAKHPEKKCVICGDSYIQVNSRQKTCKKKNCKREYRVRRQRKDYHHGTTKETDLLYKKKKYDENPELYRQKSKERYEKDKDKRNKQNLEYVKARYRVDESFRMRRRLGTALGQVIRHYIKTGKIANPMKKYGIDWKGIMKVLTPIPKPRKDYHVDHIIH